ncbi:MAG: hypothetical protein BEN19_04715 [Epulopiscium sp. Nuni2H_MBin003]|nr:MAG: hypothetical protein BEN19_04715 [Epulopiscium sp. Nuni2H_MBin003]
MVIFWFVITILLFLVYLKYKDNIFFILLISCINTGITSLITAAYTTHLIIFIISCSLCSFYVVKVKKKTFFRKAKEIQLHDLVGRKAIITKAFNSFNDVGLVKLNGDTWYAKSLMQDEFNKGHVVTVTGIEGLFVYVEKIEKNNPS